MTNNPMQAMKQGDEELVFLYDATGRREGFIWYHEGQKQGTYYYLYNMQSDVIGMVAEDMSPVVTYEYDTWGKLLSVSGEKKDTVGKLNPFRYRGYVYEEESGLYYVSSRYYDPEVARWINGDDIDVMLNHLGDSLLATNLYAYCLNNPINYHDPDGKFATVAGTLAWGTAAGGSNFWNPVGWVILGGVAVEAVGYIGYNVYKMSKGGKQRIRDTGLAGLSDSEISRRLKNPKTPKSEKERLKKEQKARGNRNKQKRGKKY